MSGIIENFKIQKNPIDISKFEPYNVLVTSKFEIKGGGRSERSRKYQVLHL